MIRRRGWKLKAEQRRKLKEPLGLLLEGSLETCVEKLKKIIEKESAPKLIAVGDVVTSQMAKARLKFDLCIVDGKIMRKSVGLAKVKVDKDLYTINPPGMITTMAWNTIKEALKEEESIRVVVEGEEDLLALPSIILAPEGSLVVYGQPQKGIVVIRVTKEKKNEARRILEEMEKD